MSRGNFLSVTTTIMERNRPIEGWCFLIDKDHNPIFGEPFPVLIRNDQTTHDLKTKIYEAPFSPKSQHLFSPNQIEIWKGKSLKLSTNDSFSRTKQLLHNTLFFEGESSVVQHLGVAQKMKSLPLKDGELLLALVPQRGTPSFPLLHVMPFSEFPWTKFWDPFKGNSARYDYD